MHYKMIEEIGSESLCAICGSISSMRKSLILCDSIFKTSSEEYRKIQSDLKMLNEYVEKMMKKRIVSYNDFSQVLNSFLLIHDEAELYISRRHLFENAEHKDAYKVRRIDSMRKVLNGVEENVGKVNEIICRLPDRPVSSEEIAEKLTSLKEKLEKNPFDIYTYAIYKVDTITLETLKDDPSIKISKGNINHAVTEFVNSDVSKILVKALEGKTVSLSEMNKCFAFANAAKLDGANYEYMSESDMIKEQNAIMDKLIAVENLQTKYSGNMDLDKAIYEYKLNTIGANRNLTVC